MKATTGNRMALERMKTDFFEYKGVKYPAGTMFKMKNPKYDFLNDVTAVYKGNLEALYPGKYCIAYNEDIDIASSIQCRNGLMWRTMMGVEKDKLEDMIVEILPGNNFVNIEARAKYVSDKDDWNLISKWIMYLIAMGITSIFKDRIVGWIVLTVLFFWWRHKYKEEECVYYE